MHTLSSTPAASPLTLPKTQHFVLVLTGFGYARALSVRADAHEARGEQHVFLREGRIVHQAPAANVRDILPFDNGRDADQHVKSILEQRAGAATMHVSELGVARRSQPKTPPKGGFLAEGVTAIVEDPHRR
jgi:hypothetical protein